MREIVKLTDKWFPCDRSPDQGTKECVCSRCGGQIPAGLRILVVRNNQAQPVLGLPAPGEYRFCRTCHPDDPGPGTVRA